jgi:Tfp pilus assembly protein PilF
MADFDNAIRLDPNYVNAYQNRASARRGLGDADGAAVDLEKSRQLSQGLQ